MDQSRVSELVGQPASWAVSVRGHWMGESKSVGTERGKGSYVSFMLVAATVLALFPSSMSVIISS